MNAWGIYIDGKLDLFFGVWDTRENALDALAEWFGSYKKIPDNAAILRVEVIGNFAKESAETRSHIVADTAMRILGFEEWDEDKIEANPDIIKGVLKYYKKIRQCIMECIEEKEASPEEIAKRDKEIEERLSNGLVGMWITDTSCEVCCQVKRIAYSSKEYRGVEIYNEDDELALNYSLKNAEDLVKYHHFEETYGDGGWSINVNIIRATDKRPNGFYDYAKRDSDIVEEGYDNQ